MHTAKITLDHSRDAKIKSRGFPILASREVNITFQRLLWNDQNSSLQKLKA
jgi:very-short-patch-repair endonuclease